MSRLDDAMVAVRTNPKDSKAWSNLGELLVADGQIEKGKQSFQRALQLDPTNQAAQRGLSGAFAAETPVAPPLAPSRPAAPPPAPERTTPTASRPAESRPAPPPPAPRTPAPQSREERSTPVKSTDTAPRPALSPQRATPTGAASERAQFRKPPPPPQKPSQTRVMMGLAVMGVIIALCLVACVALIIQF